MTYKLTVANTGDTFPAEDGETMLDVLLRNGVRVRYGCRRGKCSSCKHLVTEGEFDNSAASAYALLAEEREEGMTLLCQSYPESDCVIELVVDPAEEDGVRVPTPKTVTGTLVSAIQVSPRLWSAQLELDDALRFLPGQYVEVAVPGLAPGTRTFSVASPPFAPKQVELLIRRRDGGLFPAALDAAGPAEAVSVSGPYGRMYLRPSRRPVVLIAEGEGVAPMLSIVRYVARQGWRAPVTLLHGAGSAEELAYQGELEDWASGASAGSKGTYTTVVEPAAPKVAGELARLVEPGADVDVYVAGDAGFCDQVVFLLEARGVNPDHVYVERFFPSQEEGS